MDPRLDLDKVIRPTLARMEDSIIFNLFGRAQYKTNDIIYTPGGIQIPNFDGSFLDYLLKGTEVLHATAGRYMHPEEHPFFNDIPSISFPRKIESSPVRKTDINVNFKIKLIYLDALQKICEQGDDSHYGSSAIWDIRCLQDLSRRIHYGTYVAESKFQQEPECYSKLIRTNDIKGIRAKLTDKNVERAVLERVREKGKRYNVNPEFIVEFYEQKIIPLTIEVEVEYFLKRGID